jgi:hypothetical protein
LPKEFVLLPTPNDQNQKKENFTYTFVEGNKDRKKSIILIIAGDMRKNANQEKKDLALFEATSALRDMALKAKCKGVVSDISSEEIGNTKSLFFDRTSKGCIFSVAESWSVIVDKYFISFYLAMPEHADQKLFEEAQQSIKHVVFKK